jgi:hypothetical protein
MTFLICSQVEVKTAVGWLDPDPQWAVKLREYGRYCYYNLKMDADDTMIMMMPDHS